MNQKLLALALFSISILFVSGCDKEKDRDAAKEKPATREAKSKSTKDTQPKESKPAPEKPKSSGGLPGRTN